MNAEDLKKKSFPFHMPRPRFTLSLLLWLVTVSAIGVFLFKPKDTPPAPSQSYVVQFNFIGIVIHPTDDTALNSGFLMEDLWKPSIQVIEACDRVLADYVKNEFNAELNEFGDYLLQYTGVLTDRKTKVIYVCFNHKNYLLNEHSLYLNGFSFAFKSWFDAPRVKNHEDRFSFSLVYDVPTQSIVGDFS